MKSRQVKIRRGQIIFFILIVLVIIAGRTVSFSGLRWGQERLMFAIHPTAERAFFYAERHFDAQNTQDYNIERAQFFFRKSALLDPTLPYLDHELARIAFLQGDFKRALALINLQISLHGNETPNSYYIRGLIEGYMGLYQASALDYETFLKADPQNWAAMNDYAWVLLKANRYQDAAVVTSRGLELFPKNPWLLNSRAIALYEMNAFTAAYASAQEASAALGTITEQQWLHAYPGNDPRLAGEGVASLKKSISDNMHMMALAVGTSTVQ